MTPALVQHPGELTLRRLQVGESVAGALQEHAKTCDECQAKIRGFAEEQTRFEGDVSFERFAAGVERAARTPRNVEAPRGRWLRVAGIALAASLAVGIGVQVLRPTSGSRVKGAASLQFVVSGTGGQREAAGEAPVALAPGERVRIGLSDLSQPYVIAVSIDDRGTVTPLYDDHGHSLALPTGGGTRYLPDSLEFTEKGLERVVVLLTNSPLELNEVSGAVRRSFDSAHGNVLEMKDLTLSGEQFHRTFLKP